MIYRGFWILCRSCLFPVRLPYQSQGHIYSRFLRAKAERRIRDGPACGHVRCYRRADLKTVSFRIPDPFRRKKAVLYAIDLGCRKPALPTHGQDIRGCGDNCKRGVITGSLEALGDTCALSGACLSVRFHVRTWGIYSVDGPG